MITKNDIGKRVKYRSALASGKPYRYGVLTEYHPSHSKVETDPDSINAARPNLPSGQFIFNDLIELDNRPTLKDLGKKVQWGDHTGSLVAISKDKGVIMIDNSRGVRLEIPIWLKDVTLLAELPKHDGVLPNWQLASEKPFPTDRPILMCNAEKQTVETAFWYRNHEVNVGYWKANGSIFSLDGITHWAEMPKLPPKPVPKLTDLEVAKREVMTLWSNRTLTEKGSREHRLMTNRLRKAETKLLYEIQKSGDKRAHFIKHGQAFPYRGTEKSGGCALKDYSTEALVDLLKNHNAVAPETRTGVMDRLLYLSQQLKLAKYKP